MRKDQIITYVILPEIVADYLIEFNHCSSYKDATLMMYGNKLGTTHHCQLLLKVCAHSYVCITLAGVVAGGSCFFLHKDILNCVKEQLKGNVHCTTQCNCCLR